MKAILIRVLVWNLVALCVALPLRFFVDTVAQLKLVDFMTYIGVTMWIIGGLACLL